MTSSSEVPSTTTTAAAAESHTNNPNNVPLSSTPVSVMESLNSSEVAVAAPNAARNDVHIRIQQRSGRKTLTTVQGLPKTLDPKRALKAFKKEFACNGCIVEDPDLGEVIQLSGDQRSKIAAVLISENICTKDQIKIHGF